MNELNQLIVNHHLVEALWSAVNTSAGSLGNVAPLVKRVLETNAWKERMVPELGKDPIRFERFIDFIKEPPLKGCGWNKDEVEALIKDDVKTLAMWRDAITPPHGGKHDSKSDNITLDGRGTSRSYTVARLKRDKPELFKRVVAKEMSANAAAIKAGFRKKPVKRCPKCGHEW